MDIEKGDIYWVNIPKAHTVGSEQFKSRPYVIVSRLAWNRVANNIVGVPLSSKVEKASQHRILIPLTEISKDPLWTGTLVPSVALTDQIRVLDKTRLQQKVGSLSQSAIIALELGVSFLLDIR